MSDLKSMIAKLEEYTLPLLEKVDRLRGQLMAECSHPIESVVQAPLFELYGGDCLPPFRVCTLCGLAEDTWGCGAHYLAPGFYGKLSPISREEAYGITLFSLTDDDYYSRLRSVRDGSKKAEDFWPPLPIPAPER